MKQSLEALIRHAVQKLQQEGLLDAALQADVQITNTRDSSHGDFATNIALMLAKPAGLNPRELAQAIVAALPADEHVHKVEIAGPGFIHFFLHQLSALDVVRLVLERSERYGSSEIGKGKKV